MTQVAGTARRSFIKKNADAGGEQRFFREADTVMNDREGQ